MGIIPLTSRREKALIIFLIFDFFFIYLFIYLFIVVWLSYTSIGLSLFGLTGTASFLYDKVEDLECLLFRSLNNVHNSERKQIYIYYSAGS